MRRDVHAAGWAVAAHRGPDGVPPAAAHARVDGPSHVERHIVLPHILHRLQRILQGGQSGVAVRLQRLQRMQLILNSCTPQAAADHA